MAGTPLLSRNSIRGGVSPYRSHEWYRGKYRCGVEPRFLFNLISRIFFVMKVPLDFLIAGRPGIDICHVFQCTTVIFEALSKICLGY